jgi:hypothetical protein
MGKNQLERWNSNERPPLAKSQCLQINFVIYPTPMNDPIAILKYMKLKHKMNNNSGKYSLWLKQHGNFGECDFHMLLITKF